MKLFEKDNQRFDKYLQQPIEAVGETELEVIFGSTEYKNPITKPIFLTLLDRCKEYYHFISEENSLDIRQEYSKGMVSNVRCTITGLQSIKKYCKQESLDDIDNLIYIQKKYYKNPNEPTYKFQPLRDDNYNIRLTLKKEESLLEDDTLVTNFMSKFERVKKHFRYKKRFSFITQDKLFRIDLTVIKSSKRKNGKDVLEKTFKASGILGNPETYELEIEYVGDKEKKTGDKLIDDLYDKIQEGQIINGPGSVTMGSIFDPMNISPYDEFSGNGFTPSHVLELDVDEYVITEEEKMLPYIDDDGSEVIYGSPRYDKMVKVESYKVSSVKYSQESYETLLGKFIRIKDDFWVDNPQFTDIKSGLNDIKDRQRDGIIIDVVEKIQGDGEYIATYVIISLDTSIDEKPTLTVPIDQIYGRFEITPSEIRETTTIIGGEEEEPIIQGGGAKKVPSWAVAGKKAKKLKPMDELKKLVSNFLEQHVLYLSKIIYNTDRFISLQVKDDIIQAYKRLTGQKSKYFTFMGPQPVTLTNKHIVPGRRSILLDYAVTEKADGDRYEMFIYNKKAFLLNSKQDVIDTGVTFHDIEGEWLFDGEYITKDKENNSINLYMVFDVYYCGKLRDERPDFAKKDTREKFPDNKLRPLHNYPFVGESPTRIDRHTILNDFFMSMFHNVTMEEGSIEIDKKEYMFGFNWAAYPVKYEMTNEQNVRIFEASREILKKSEDGYFQYRIDGLIYIPLRLSVKGSIQGVPMKYINGQWDYNYKWKPPEENTIDFMIKVETDVVKSKVRDKIYEYSMTEESGNRIIGEYKHINLYVGYDNKKDKTLDYCMMILEATNMTKKDIIPFDGDDIYNKTNIPLVNGRMLCSNFNRDEIKDGDIVELRFNPDAENGMYWEPLRIRSDKIRPQDFMVAKNVWDTILHPVTTDMIQGGYKEKEIRDSVMDNTKYYVNDEEDDLPELIPLRKFHNYIKSNLIGGICSSFSGKPIKYLDLSCGRGGDIPKYVNRDNNISFILGLDIASNVSEACMRFYHTKNRGPGVFLQADTSKNIMNGECSDVEDMDDKAKEHTDVMLSILYNRTNNVPQKYSNIFKTFKNKATNGFDIVSSQFSMHYYFETQETFNGFIQNLNDNIAPGGYFIGTCYDGKRIFELNDDVTQYEDKQGHLVYRIEKKYTIENFEDEETMFGQQIDVYMDSIGKSIPEYLVNFEFFTKVMNDNGFELSIPKVDFKHSTIFQKKYMEHGMGHFGKIIPDLPLIHKNDSYVREHFTEALKVKQNKGLSLLSGLNNYFIFQKK